MLLWNLYQAADRLHVPPWELASRPLFWLLTTLDVMEIEGELEKRRQKPLIGYPGY